MTAALTKRLTKLGLTDKESEVYMALLQGGEMTADQLAKISKLNRSTAYVQIKLLQERGLVSTFKRGKKTYFAAESPNNLTRVINKLKQEIEHQETEVTLLVPELLNIFGSAVDRPTARVFEGKEGLASMRNSILEEKPKKMYMITSYNQMLRVFTNDELTAFTKKREQAKIESNIIYTLDEGDDFKPFHLQKLKRVNPEALTSIGSDVYIYNNFVSFASAKDQIVGLTIENEDIANSMRFLFKSLWGKE
ncbi:MAG: ArsR family transcriptional regulator [Cytophagaceae bacterium]|nr:ArsR family transcriptional regulator [Cytophagaceae bacterium]